MKLTAQLVDDLKLKPSETDRIWFDDAVPGFGLRVRQTGSRSWIFQYKIGSKNSALCDRRRIGDQGRPRS